MNTTSQKKDSLIRESDIFAREGVQRFDAAKCQKRLGLFCQTGCSVCGMCYKSTLWFYICFNVCEVRVLFCFCFLGVLVASGEESRVFNSATCHFPWVPDIQW